MNKRTLLLLLLFSVALAFYSQNAFADGSYACSYSGDCSDTGTSPFSGSGCYPSDLTGTYTAVCKLGVTYSCSYCSNGCSGGACNPAPACIPSCSGDQCGQNNGCGGSCPSTDASTPGKCGNPATPKDPCAGVTCSTPPAATCSGSNRVTYSSSGTCSNGACSYSSSSTYCAYGCSAGACNPEPAASKPLAQPATSVCGNGATESGEECDDGLSTTSGTRYCSTGIVSYDACINCKSQPAPECQTPKCTPNEEVSRSCSGCKTTTLTMCNSDGTATYQLPNQYASECTSGCPTQAPPTCIDNDKDGYWQRTSTCTAGTDCNDNNAAINLGVTEPSCDSDTIDNDCKNGDAPACSTETAAACTPSAWSCTLPTECPSTGFKTSTCTLIDTTCTNPEAAKPATTTQSCTPPPQCGSENEKCCTANTCNTGLNCIENKVGYTIISAVCKKTAQQTAPACIDNDGDGYGSNCAKGTDCNDNNPAINPAASEPACDSDNIDNNCDGLDAPACTTTTTPTPTPTPVCGDNTCNGPETTASCPTDCKELKTDIAVTGLTVSTSYPSIIIPKVIKNVNEVVDFEFTVLNAGDTTVSHYSYNFFYGNGAAGGGFSNVEIPPKKSTTNGFSYAYTQTGWFSFSVNAITQGDSNTANNRLAAEIYVVNHDENNVINKGGYFVLGNSYLMQYVGADALTTNNPSATAKFKNVATGEILQVAGGSLQGSIKIGEATYIYTPKSDPKYADYNILVDLNGDSGFGEVTGITCIDSDKSEKYPDGKNYYVKSEAKGDVGAPNKEQYIFGEEPSLGSGKPSPYPYSISKDYCENDELAEAVCVDNIVRYSSFKCQNGCKEGACVQQLAVQSECGLTCGSKTCKPYEKCVVEYREEGSPESSCKISTDCGATCNDFVKDYSTVYTIKENQCGEYLNCVATEDENGNEQLCNEGKHLCIGSCIDTKYLPVCPTPKIIRCDIENQAVKIDWETVEGAKMYGLKFLPCKDELCNTMLVRSENILTNRGTFDEIMVSVEEAASCIPTDKFSESMKCLNFADSNVKVIPDKGVKGTVFAVKVEWVAGLNLKASLSKGGTNLKEFSLYDDGAHGDEERADGVYSNIFDSSLLEDGLYSVTIKLDRGVEETIKETTIKISKKEECLEVIPGHNNKEEKRVNVVFVGYDYNNYDVFRRLTLESVGFNGEGKGILTQEPFLSNKDKFNFWMVSEIKKGVPAEFTDPIKFTIAKLRADRYVYNAASACKFPNREVVFLLNRGAGENKFGFGQSHITFVFMPENKEDSPIFTYSGYKNYDVGMLVIHEFGHSFGALGDEYVKSKILTTINKLVRNDKNIITDSYCNEWKKFEGNGCKKDGKIDCIDSYNSEKDEIACNDGNFYCFVEVACFRGADDKNAYRSVYNSIMRNPFLAIERASPRAFGPINERLLCEKIKEATGSAGGICNEIE